jgi:hypothetical protein
MQCSVCAAPASNITPGDFDGLVVRCPHCHDYEIAGTVMDKFLRLQLSERMDVLRKAQAQAKPGIRPSITSLSF